MIKKILFVLTVSGALYANPHAIIYDFGQHLDRAKPTIEEQEKALCDEKSYYLIEHLRKIGVPVGIVSTEKEEISLLMKKPGTALPANWRSYTLSDIEGHPYQALLDTLELQPDAILFVTTNQKLYASAKEAGLQVYLFSSFEKMQTELVERGFVQE